MTARPDVDALAQTVAAAFDEWVPADSAQALRSLVLRVRELEASLRPFADIGYLPTMSGAMLVSCRVREYEIERAREVLGDDA